MLDIKLRCANHNDISDLKKLWQICFNDRMEYIDIFFENMFVAENTLVAEVDNKIAGVVYILERTLNDKRFFYGYAIGVFPNFRGNNICKIMLNRIREYTKLNDIIFGLHPANDKLARFYQRIGLDEMYSLKYVDASSFSSHQKYEPDDITLDEFYAMRKKAFYNFVTWDKNALGYMIKCGEIVKKINIEGIDRYFVITLSDDAVVVKETTAKDEEIKKVSQSIKKHFKKDTIYYFLPGESSLEGDLKPMIYGFSEKDDKVYMNLFLD